MSLVDLCRDGDLEGVRAALENGDNVNMKDEDDMTGLNRAVENNHSSVVALLLKTPNIEVNLKGHRAWCKLYELICTNLVVEAMRH